MLEEPYKKKTNPVFCSQMDQMGKVLSELDKVAKQVIEKNPGVKFS